MTIIVICCFVLLCYAKYNDRERDPTNRAYNKEYCVVLEWRKANAMLCYAMLFCDRYVGDTVNDDPNENVNKKRKEQQISRSNT